MVVMAAITTVFTLGVAFYVRFFIALCNESKRRWIGYLVRIEPGEEGSTEVDPQPKPEEAFDRVTPADMQCV